MPSQTRKKPLPIDSALAGIVAAIRRERRLVLIAPPGSGKTTRVPPELTGDGAVLVLQPRRIAARSLAKRIAWEQEWTLGEEVGWQVRFEKRFTSRTRLLVATEGVLTARLQSDPLLSGFRTVILDEFHERSLHADLALALTKQAMNARDDLRLVIMSATMDALSVSRYLDDAPVIEVEARAHPVEIRHRPHHSLRQGVEETVRDAGGHVLVFLPGAGEISRAAEEVRPLGLPLFPLHGRLSPAEQDLAIATEGASRRIILATNVAETSLTVEGVGAVVDSGLQKVLRYDPSRGLDRLEVERISLDSAGQRAGRAGRTGPGIAIRLWDERQILAEHRQPEIGRVDLAAPLLEILAWGEDPVSFDWFERPPEAALMRGVALLEDLGAAREGAITPRGKAMQRLPLHPRHAVAMLEAADRQQAGAACAILSEGAAWGESRGEADILDLVARIAEAPHAVRAAADQVRQVIGAASPGSAPLPRALYAGYRDRLGRRREGSERFQMASGSGATIARGRFFPPDPEFLVALDMTAGARAAADGVIRVAAAVERDWIEPTSVEERVWIDAGGEVKAAQVEKAHAIDLRQRSVRVDPERAASVLAAAVERILTLADEGAPLPSELVQISVPRDVAASVETLRRSRLAGSPVSIEETAARMVEGRIDMPPIRVEPWLTSDAKRAIDKLAPDVFMVPSGRKSRLDYRADGSVVLAVKLQELFGLAESPRVGAGRIPVTIELLAPNGRPVQTTADLRSFWNGAYQEIRKELRSRYPKHPWPEDPWTAVATHRTVRKPR
ncbi:MAG TPA: ATP-dependent RNA helicase [Thermoanaerobaculia bacterium]|nr:ATP-dependent RNA helicase [Thermoanaerobaculia bacterium]